LIHVCGEGAGSFYASGPPAKQQFSASAGLVRIADDMWRALMDIQSDRR